MRSTIQDKIVKKSINLIRDGKMDQNKWYPNMELKPLRGSKFSGSPQPKKASVFSTQSMRAGLQGEIQQQKLGSCFIRPVAINEFETMQSSSETSNMSAVKSFAPNRRF